MIGCGFSRGYKQIRRESDYTFVVVECQACSDALAAVSDRSRRASTDLVERQRAVGAVQKGDTSHTFQRVIKQHERLRFNALFQEV